MFVNDNDRVGRGVKNRPRFRFLRGRAGGRRLERAGHGLERPAERRDLVGTRLLGLKREVTLGNPFGRRRQELRSLRRTNEESEREPSHY